MKVSVIIASYGSQEWLKLAGERALPSVPSAENTQVAIHHEPDGTLAGTRNRAAVHASGDFLCFLDADDELTPGYLDEMRRAMHHWNLFRRGDLIANPLLLSPSVQYVRDGTTIGDPELPNRHEPMERMNHCVIGTLIPRLMFEAVGGFRDLPIYEDWALFLACVRAGARVVDVPDAVYRAHVRGDSRNVGPEAHATYVRIRDEHAAG